MAKKLSVVLGVVFLLIGVLGFISNPIVGEMGLFHTDLVHNIVHVLSGIIFLVVGLKSAHASVLTLKVFGIVYLLVAILGFLAVDASGMGSILGLVGVNSADNWLHVILAVVIGGAGFMLKDDTSMSSAPMQQM